jgi:hypothetical protein
MFVLPVLARKLLLPNGKCSVGVPYVYPSVSFLAYQKKVVLDTSDPCLLMLPSVSHLLSADHAQPCVVACTTVMNVQSFIPRASYA